MGGLVALRTALRHPGRVRGLVLLNTTADWRGNTAVKELWDSPIGGMRDPVDPVFVREFQLSTIATQLPGSFIDAVVSESLKVPARIWRATFADFRQTSLVADLARIDAPTLIVWGDRDSICLRHDQDTLAAGIRGARCIVHPGAGHAAHWDAPDLVAADLVNFCHQLSGRS
jgi:pimeloyl-ACP methyl ester carboxylesterase